MDTRYITKLEIYIFFCMSNFSFAFIESRKWINILSIMYWIILPNYVYIPLPFVSKCLFSIPISSPDNHYIYITRIQPTINAIWFWKLKLPYRTNNNVYHNYSNKTNHWSNFPKSISGHLKLGNDREQENLAPNLIINIIRSS